MNKPQFNPIFMKEFGMENPLLNLVLQQERNNIKMGCRSRLEKWDLGLNLEIWFFAKFWLLDKVLLNNFKWVFLTMIKYIQITKAIVGRITTKKQSYLPRQRTFSVAPSSRWKISWCIDQTPFLFLCLWFLWTHNIDLKIYHTDIKIIYIIIISWNVHIRISSK